MSSEKTKLFGWLSLKALMMILVILYAGIELGPDEAQYWTWSRALDWGYYSKPPAIAWQIWAGTELFGHSEWGIRSLSVLLSFFQAWAVYFLALRAGLHQQSAYWCAILMAFSPLGFLGSLFAITDGGFLLCWTGACMILVSALREKKEPSPYLVGGWILAGALFKWPIFLFWIFYLLFRHWYFPEQKKSSVLLGILLSMGALLPSIWWNWSNEWATFKHVLATIQGGSGSHKGSGNFPAFLGSQALLLSPILFFLLLLSCYHWIKKRRELTPALFFCGFVTIGILTAGLLLSCFQKLQGNWTVFAYPTGIILLGWYCFQLDLKKIIWAKTGLGLSLIILGFFVFNNPLKHNRGWNELHQALKKNGYDPKRHFLVSDKYQGASILSFYSEGQKRAYFLNLNQNRKNQFSYWPSFQQERQVQTGYFVWIENKPHLQKDWKEKLAFYKEKLPLYFEEVELLDFSPLILSNGEMVKGALIFQCKKCKNTPLPDSLLY